MICPECRGGTHGKCANLRQDPVSLPAGCLPNWCDCQHVPGTSLSPEAAREKDENLGVAPGDTSPAAVHLPA